MAFTCVSLNGSKCSLIQQGRSWKIKFAVAADPAWASLERCRVEMSGGIWSCPSPGLPTFEKSQAPNIFAKVNRQGRWLLNYFRLIDLSKPNFPPLKCHKNIKQSSTPQYSYMEEVDRRLFEPSSFESLHDITIHGYSGPDGWVSPCR